MSTPRKIPPTKRPVSSHLSDQAELFLSADGLTILVALPGQPCIRVPAESCADLLRTRRGGRQWWVKALPALYWALRFGLLLPALIGHHG
jgi:hypothetical protein